MKKKIISLAMAAVLMLATACGPSTPSSAPSGTTSGSSGTTSGGGQDAGLQKIRDAGKLKVGCKVDVPSFGYQNTQTGVYEGLEIDISYAIAAEIFGVTPQEAKEKGLCEFQGVTAKTRGALLDNGEIDIVAATFTITEERKLSWNFSSPYMQDALGLMCKVSSGYSTMADIDGAIIGVAQGATTKDAIQAYIAEQGLAITVEFQEFDGYPALKAALSADNIDIFSVDRAILAGYNDDTTMILPERFATQEYGITTALYATELTQVVEKVVSGLLQSGQLAQMISQWGIE